jgi:predicted amidohydrolase
VQIAAVQHDIAWQDSATTTQRLADRVAQAAQSGARLVLLSEMFATGFSMDTARVAQGSDGPIASFLAESAARHQCWVGGSFACVTDEYPRPTNRFVIAGPQGEQHFYDKLHPFSYANEHLAYSAGTTTRIVTIEGVRCALFVCYDLRFADEFWDLASDTDVYLVPANWPDSRAHHWRSLLIARAIENQAYVVGCNRVGTAEQLRYQGDSMIIDPLGRVLAQAAHAECTVQADIDPAVVADTRHRFPFLADRATNAR